MLTLFGIPNCDQVKKSQKWLNDHNIIFEFHDLKKQGITRTQLAAWCNAVTWENLLNKRSKTWKALSEKQRADLSATKAISLMQRYPTLIKRPVIQFKDKIETGFDQTRLRKLFL